MNTQDKCCEACPRMPCSDTCHYLKGDSGTCVSAQKHCSECVITDSFPIEMQSENCHKESCACHPAYTNWERVIADCENASYLVSEESHPESEHLEARTKAKAFIERVMEEERKKTVYFIRGEIRKRGTYDLNYDDIYEAALSHEPAH